VSVENADLEVHNVHANKTPSQTGQSHTQKCHNAYQQRTALCASKMPVTVKYVDITVGDNPHRSSPGTFHVTPDSTTLTTIPNCNESASMHVSRVHFSQYHIITHHT